MITIPLHRYAAGFENGSDALVQTPLYETFCGSPGKTTDRYGLDIVEGVSEPIVRVGVNHRTQLRVSPWMSANIGLAVPG